MAKSSKSKPRENPQLRLKELGQDLAQQIQKGKNPEMEFGLRSLSNVVYDTKSRTLNLGSKTQTRSFFNVGHAKKFLQTVEMAKVSKTLLDVEKHASLRDVFYMAKRTIPNSTINIVDEQAESDSAIEDMELITGFSREQLNINANKMGSVAGEVTIEDAGDTINWARLGSGGWSIPSNVETMLMMIEPRSAPMKASAVKSGGNPPIEKPRLSWLETNATRRSSRAFRTSEKSPSEMSVIGKERAFRIGFRYEFTMARIRATASSFHQSLPKAKSICGTTWIAAHTPTALIRTFTRRSITSLPPEM